jgi:hypothetical protein
VHIITIGRTVYDIIVMLSNDDRRSFYWLRELLILRTPGRLIICISGFRAVVSKLPFVAMITSIPDIAVSTVGELVNYTAFKLDV